MNFRNFFLVSIIMVLGFNVASQTLKKYSGAFPLSEPWSQDAKITCSFFDEKSGKVYDGKFTLSIVGKDNFKGVSQNITGFFKKGLRDGKWIFTVSYNDWKLTENNYYKTGASTLTINYKSGLPDNLWSFSGSYKIRQKTEQVSKTGFTAFSKVTKQNIKMNFKEGILNTFLYESLGLNPKDAIRYTYTFDEAGFLQNIAKDIESSKSDEIWYHGLDKSSDDEKLKMDKYLYYLKIAEDSLAYLPYSYKKLVFRENKKINENDSSINISNLLLSIYNDIFLWNDIPGDLHFDTTKSKQDYLVKLTMPGFYTRELYKQSPKEKTLNAEQAEMFSNINKLLKSVQSVIIEPKLNKCSKIEAASQNYSSLVKYRDTIAQVQDKINALEKYYKGVSSFSSFQEVFSNTEFLKNISEKDILNYILNMITSIEKIVLPLTKDMEKTLNDFEYDFWLNEGNTSMAQKNYPAAMKAFETAKILKPEEQEPITKIKELTRREALKGAEDQRMKNFSYLSEHFRKIPVNYKSGEIKKHLYNAYLILKEYMVSEMDNSKYDAYQKLEISKQVIKLVDKMNELLNSDTEELEKQLKKTKEPEKIKEILGI